MCTLLFVLTDNLMQHATCMCLSCEGVSTGRPAKLPVQPPSLQWSQQGGAHQPGSVHTASQHTAWTGAGTGRAASRYSDHHPGIVCLGLT